MNLERSLSHCRRRPTRLAFEPKNIAEHDNLTIATDATRYKGASAVGTHLTFEKLIPPILELVILSEFHQGTAPPRKRRIDGNPTFRQLYLEPSPLGFHL